MAGGAARSSRCAVPSTTKPTARNDHRNQPVREPRATHASSLDSINKPQSRACSGDVPARLLWNEVSYTIFDGTSEIQRLVVGRSISGLRIP